jgi:3-hydroxy-9,10-secoandrosta-1,3,5(10)-triene-9,17-dione monooxygenase
LTIKSLDGYDRDVSAPTAIAPPEPGLTPDEMLERVRALVPTLRERQAATEAAGRVLDETQAALVDAGLYRAMQPRRFGGYEFSLRDFVRVMTEVSRGCPSTGWSVTLTAGHPHLLSH